LKVLRISAISFFENLVSSSFYLMKFLGLLLEVDSAALSFTLNCYLFLLEGEIPSMNPWLSISSYLEFGAFKFDYFCGALPPMQNTFINIY